MKDIRGTCGFCGNEPSVGTQRNKGGGVTRIGTNCKKDLYGTPVNQLKLKQDAERRNARLKAEKEAKGKNNG